MQQLAQQRIRRSRHNQAQLTRSELFKANEERVGVRKGELGQREREATRITRARPNRRCPQFDMLHPLRALGEREQGGQGGKAAVGQRSGGG